MIINLVTMHLSIAPLDGIFSQAINTWICGLFTGNEGLNLKWKLKHYLLQLTQVTHDVKMFQKVLLIKVS